MVSGENAGLVYEHRQRGHHVVDGFYRGTALFSHDVPVLEQLHLLPHFPGDRIVPLPGQEFLEERNRANSHLQSALSDLEASTAEIRKLQSGLQVICAWTKQVKVGDKWMNPEEFLTNHLHLHLTHGISPEASLGFEKELEKLRA